MLPENFDGIVRFTNWTDEDFVATYNSKTYFFPKETTSPLTLVDMSHYDDKGNLLQKLASPIELLNICKKFALDLATREWGKTQWYKDQLKRERNVDGSPRGYGFSGASTYDINDPAFSALIQKGLYIYPAAKAKISDMARPKLEDKLSKDPEGRLNTKAVRQGAGLQDTIDEFAKTK